MSARIRRSRRKASRRLAGGRKTAAVETLLARAGHEGHRISVSRRLPRSAKRYRLPNVGADTNRPVRPKHLV